MADRWAVASPASEDWQNTDAWSATDGGASGASVPIATDNVFLKNLVGVIDVSSGTCANLDCTGCAGTLSLGGTLTVTGDTLTLVAGMTLSAGGGGFTLTGANAAGDITLTRAGKTGSTPYTFNGVGKVFKLADAHNIGTSAFTLTNGTLNSQGFNLTCQQLSTSNANVRTATLTGSVLTQTTVFSIANTTNLTWSAPAEISVPLSTSIAGTLCSFSSSVPILTVRLDATGATVGGSIGNNATGALGGLDIGELRFTGTQPAASLTTVITVSSNCIIDKFAAPEGVQFISSARGTQRTITTGTNEISFDGCMIRDIVISGGPAIAINSIDLGNNSGITFQNFGPATHEIVGVTYDDAGAALPSCLVVAFKEDGGVLKEVSRTTSDGTTGAYTLPTPDAAASGYTILATKTSANRGDAMVGITPQAP